MFFSRVAIIGVGLIGGSLGLFCRDSGIAQEVIGVGRDRSRLEHGVRLGAIDSCCLSLQEGVSDADLIVIATPVSTMTGIASQIKPYIKAGAIIIDVGSVKGELVGLMDSLFYPDAFFIGCHPIAGKEKSGVAAAERDLFLGAKAIITPTRRTDPGALATMREFWSKAGSEVILMDTDRHDKVFSAISHLPQMIAFSLANQIDDMRGSEPEILDFAGGGLRDSLRLGGSSPDMWKDIALLNKSNIVDSLRQYKKVVDRLLLLMEAGDAEGMEKFFRNSNTMWNMITKR